MIIKGNKGVISITDISEIKKIVVDKLSKDNRRVSVEYKGKSVILHEGAVENSAIYDFLESFGHYIKK